MAKGSVVINRERCKGCELCVRACPQGILHLSTTFNARGYHPIELDDPTGACTGCSLCALVCPDLVFTVYREPARRPVAA